MSGLSKLSEFKASLKKLNDVEKIYEKLLPYIKKEVGNNNREKSRYFYYIFNSSFNSNEDFTIIKKKLRTILKNEIEKYEQSINRFSSVVNDDAHYTEEERLISLLKRTNEQNDLELLNRIFINIYLV
jgi:hypothetical protein